MQPAVRAGFFLILVLVSGWAAQWTMKAGWPELFPAPAMLSITDVVMSAVPRQARDLGADFLWLTADEYIHFGPSHRAKKAFLAGAYGGNTEILPLLELALLLDPTHMDAYAILSQNLSLYFERFRAGIRLLQHGILHNRQAPRLHELYGTIAYAYGFVQSYGNRYRNDRVIALRYLDAALAAWKRTGQNQPSPDPVLNPANYQIMRARFLVEQGRKEEALAAWRASGEDLWNNRSLLAEFLRLVAQGKPTPALPEDLHPALAAPATGSVSPSPIAASTRPDNQPPAPSAAATETFSQSPDPVPGPAPVASPDPMAALHPPGENEKTCDHSSGACGHEIEPPKLMFLTSLSGRMLGQFAFYALAILVLAWPRRVFPT